MSEESKTVARQLMERFDRRDQAGVLELCAEDSVFHGFAEKSLDREGFRRSMAEYMDAFPDMRVRLDDLFSEDNKVALRYYMEGTNQGDFMGMAATGKPVSVYTGASLVIENGKIKEFWQHADNVGMMFQLGLVQFPDRPTTP